MDYDGKDKPHSETGGVDPIPIQGRFASVRERLAGGFTDADREWRKQWLKDQILHDEPVTPEWYYKERYNPIRRFYRWPLDTLFGAKTLEENNFWRYASRYWAGRTLLGIAGLYVGVYIMKYHSNDWTNVSGWEWVTSKEFRPMGHPRYGVVDEMKPSDYHDKLVGFDDKVPI